MKSNRRVYWEVLLTDAFNIVVALAALAVSVLIMIASGYFILHFLGIV